ncbi:MAG: hypothetical protein RI964_858 [Pseudomonadota bacterium]
MFKVFLDGVYHSTHDTFHAACRHARKQAALNQGSYFTVFETDEKIQLVQEDSSELMLGVPDYIITPHQAETTERRASPVLRMNTSASYAAVAR